MYNDAVTVIHRRRSTPPPSHQRPAYPPFASECRPQPGRVGQPATPASGSVRTTRVIPFRFRQPKSTRVTCERRCAPHELRTRVHHLAPPSMAPRSRCSDKPCEARASIALHPEVHLGSFEDGAATCRNTMLGSPKSRLLVVAEREDFSSAPVGRKQDVRGHDHEHERLHDSGRGDRSVGAANEGDGGPCGASPRTMLSPSELRSFSRGEAVPGSASAPSKSATPMRLFRIVRHRRTRRRTHGHVDDGHHGEPEDADPVHGANHRKALHGSANHR